MFRRSCSIRRRGSNGCSRLLLGRQRRGWKITKPIIPPPIGFLASRLGSSLSIEGCSEHGGRGGDVAHRSLPRSTESGFALLLLTRLHLLLNGQGSRGRNSGV